MMGDITKSDGTLLANNESETDAGKQSIQLLKETKELSDIRKADETSPETVNNEQKPSEVRGENEGHKKEESVATVFKSTTIDNTVSSVNASAAVIVPQPPKEVTNSQMSARSGRLNKLRDHASNIFPTGVMGCKDDETLPSPRRLLDAQEASQDTIGHIENTPRKMSAKIDHGRNPVLGTGVESEDQLKKGNKKNADGNPVLGEGYQDTITRVSSGSSTRIPPGGYSQGLW